MRRTPRSRLADSNSDEIPATLFAVWGVLLFVSSLLGCAADRGARSISLATGGRTTEVAPAEVYPAGYGPNPMLPEPFATPQASRWPKVIGWPAGRAPSTPAGFTVSLYADGLESPRWLHVLPNGDVLVAESSFSRENWAKDLPPDRLAAARAAGLLRTSPNRIVVLRDADGDGSPEMRETFLAGLKQPFGMALLGDALYVANTDALLRFPYREGQTRIEGKGEKVLDLPAQGDNIHWTRNVVASPDRSKLYVSVGSATNVDEEGIDAQDPRRAAILELDPDGGGVRVFASGLRNPVGMDWAPGTGALWTVVVEREGLGEALVPDYLTSVRPGAFYGWPYAYFGQHADPRHAGERPDKVTQAVAPDYALGAHSTPTGLLFYRGRTFPDPYRGGAFISQRGSVASERFTGYRVVFVPFEGGRPSGPPREFLTGFIANEEAAEVYGRPMGLAELPDGSLLLADDAGNRIWRVAFSR